MRDHEYWQFELKTNSLQYIDSTKVCKVYIVFWKEFSGKITQAIVERNSSSKTPVKYLFIRTDTCDSFRNRIAPMYFDRGDGGLHHTVTGLGVRMYGALKKENELICNLVDKATSPDVLFKPVTTEASQKFNLARLSQYGVLPAGWDVQQLQIKGGINDGLAMFRTTSELMRSNLSSFRQPVPMEMRGNPPTKFQKQLEAQQASALSNTTFNRYYRQLDLLYNEIATRACNTGSTDPRAKDYQERCVNRGVPKECFKKVESVRAIRIIGQGSAFLRREAINSLGEIVASLPEDGRNNWLNAKIAAEAGQSAVQLFNPEKVQSQLQDDQTAEAMLQVAAMRVGVPAVVTSSQNALRFAGIFLKACVDALQTLQQGANPAEVVKFIDLAGPASMQHVRRILNDPIRKGAAEEIYKQLMQVMQASDKIKEGLAKQAQEQQQQQAKQQKTMGELELKQAKTVSGIKMSEAKTAKGLELKEREAKQQMAIADAKAASEIDRANKLAAAQAAAMSEESETE